MKILSKEFFMEKIIYCAVCGTEYKTSGSINGECKNCGWYNNSLGEKNSDAVIYPNLISLEKAKKLYAEKKPFVPSLDDFLDGFSMYGEMQFKYKNFECSLFRSNNEGGIEFDYCDTNNGHSAADFFTDGAAFKENAKLDGKYVREIWNDVFDADYC